MVSPYLQRPMRTLKQAQKDRARRRRRSKAAKSRVRMLPSLAAGHAAGTRGMPQPPTDRQAA